MSISIISKFIKNIRLAYHKEVAIKVKAYHRH
jgi:hypothetical protein